MASTAVLPLYIISAVPHDDRNYPTIHIVMSVMNK